MKPFLAIDITKNKKNDLINGEEFVTRRVSQLQADLRDRAIEGAQSQEDKSKLPAALQIIRGICMFFGLIMLYGIIKAVGGEEGVTIAQAYENAPILFWLCGLFMIGWLSLSVLGKKQERRVTQSEETSQIISRVDQAVRNSYAELGVPASAVAFDLLMFRYMEKKGQVVPTSFGPSAFISCAGMIFTENGNLCFADADQRYEFPMSAIRRIVTVKKDGAVPAWNKDVPTNKPPYKHYKLRIDNYGFIHFKPYYILELEIDGETWGIYFPCYELPTIESLTGHHPQI